MTTNDTFGQTLATWLHEEAEHAMPDHLGEILVRTVATSQRKWWSSPERWLPLDTTTRFRGRIAAPRALIWVAVVMLLVLALAGAAVFTGVLGPAAPLTGLATNGRILVADGTELRSFAADGTDPQLVQALPDGATGLTISPDGTKLAYATSGDLPSMQVRTLADGSTITVPIPAGSLAGDQIGWSPTGDRIVFGTFDGTNEHLFIAPVDGSPATELGGGTIPTVGLWWPAWSPDGKTISFLTDEGGTSSGALNVIHPDGTGFQRVETPTVSVGDAGGNLWSPEPGVLRLLYVGSGNTVRLHDFAAGTDVPLVGGFWPTWSPDGKHLAFWGDGTLVISTDDAIHGKARQTRLFNAFQGSCQDNTDLGGKAFCGPARWSPDGSRLIAPDIAGTSVLSLPANGEGSPIVIPLGSDVRDKGNPVAWLPIRP